MQCDKKRSVLPARRLKDEVLAEVLHRQRVFMISKRLRVYFRYDEKECLIFLLFARKCPYIMHKLAVG